jgi:putative ABC transport system permease protein
MLSLSIKEMSFFKLRYLLIGFILFFLASLVFIISGLAHGLASDNSSAMVNMNAEGFYVSDDSEHRLDRSQLIGLNAAELRENGGEVLGLQMKSMEITGQDARADVVVMGINAGGFLMPKVSEGAGLEAAPSGGGEGSSSGEKVKASEGQSSSGEKLKAAEGEKSSGEGSVGVDSSVSTHSLQPFGAVADITLKDEGVAIGDVLYDSKTDTRFIVRGFVEGYSYSHAPALFIDVSAWEAMLPGDNVYYNTVALQNTDASDSVASLLDSAELAAKDDIIAKIPGYKAEQSSLGMIVTFLLIIVVFVLGAFFYIMTIQKSNQFGILKAIGATNRFLILSTVIQVIALSLLSIGLAIGFAAILKMVMPDGMPFVFDIGLITQYSLIMLGIALVGAGLSGAGIVKADPLQAMGRAD